MGKVNLFFRSFTGGELTPEFWAQFTDAKYQTGLARCRNFIPLPHGPAMNRSGFGFVSATKHSGSKASRIIPFTFSSSQTMAIELGEGYFRFHTQGATLLVSSPAAYDNATAYSLGDLVSSAGANYYCIADTTGNAPPNASYWYALPASGEYEIPNAYAEADLMDIHFVQSSDVLTLVHPNYPPAELRRYGATDWRLEEIAFTSQIPAPSGVGVTATTGSGSINYTYVVTTVGSGSENNLESLASAEVTCTNNLPGSTSNKNTITWTAPAGYTLFNIYRKRNGIFGFIGQATGTSFDDTDGGISADFTKSVLQANNPFPGAGDYPGAASYYEQRRCFAGTTNKPQNLWMTRSSTESDMSYSLLSQDNDSVEFKVAAREANIIRHIVPLQQLVLLTSSAEWRVTSVNSDAITPSNVAVHPQSFVGANNAQPVIINNTVLFAAERGGHMREMAYSWQANGYLTGDLSLRAPHLFDGYTITDLAYAKAPFPLVWAVSSSGDLLGLTYVPEQQVGAWHWHDTTNGAFESICVVAEGNEDMLYAIVRRTINGSTVRYVERMATRRYFATLADAFFVDAGLTYSGAPATTISGLDHLEGETVSILADGAVVPQQVVSGGQITLPSAASVVTVGLPIEADLQTLPFAAMVDNAAGQGKRKNVNKADIRIYSSSGLKAGPSVDKLTTLPLRSTEPYGSPPSLRTGEVSLLVAESWSSTGQICIRQSDPLPLEVVSIALDVEVSV